MIEFQEKKSTRPKLLYLLCCSLFCAFVLSISLIITLALVYFDILPEGPFQPNLKQRLPKAIIIGVKKAGTRALLEYLRQHPAIKAAGPEVHFFDRYYNRGLDWYRRQMPLTESWQTTIEKTPSYFVTKSTPARLKAINPDIKLIIVVRDPVTRALSDYAQNVAKKPGYPKFEEMAFLNRSSGVVNTSWGAIKIGLYYKHIKRWLEHFPREQFHFVSGERLISHPAEETNLVEDFLHLNRTISQKNFYFNSPRKFPCLWKSNEQGGRPRCLRNTKGRPHPNVAGHLVEHLKRFYEPNNERFFRLIGKRFLWGIRKEFNKIANASEFS